LKTRFISTSSKLPTANFCIPVVSTSAGFITVSFTFGAQPDTNIASNTISTNNPDELFLFFNPIMIAFSNQLILDFC